MLSETDLNLLDAYLDDALPAGEVQSLDARLSEDHEIAAALDSLRSERAARVAAFQSLTPEPAQADRFVKGVLSSIRRQQFSRRVVRGLTWVGGLAACLIVGFSVGWIGRGNSPTVAIAQPVPGIGEKKPPSANPPLLGRDDKTLNQAPTSTKPTASFAGFGITTSDVGKDDPLRVLYPALGSRPAVKIDAVAPNSIADKSGMRAGDVLLTGGGDIQILRGNKVLKVIVELRPQE